MEQRKATLPLFHKLANLPAETLKKYMRPEIFHSRGWSHGVEQFQGKYDTGKGSFYVNCVQDEPVSIPGEADNSYGAGNVWVDAIPEM